MRTLHQPFADQPDLFVVDDILAIGPGARLTIRSTILRHEGRLAILSPVRFDDALMEAINALGVVDWLIAPNLYHHLFLARAKLRWPSARIAAPRGLEKKQPTISIEHWLEDGSPWPALIQTQRIAGVPLIGEHALLHTASKTLIVTDLLFHVLEAPNFATWMMLNVVSGTLGRCAPSRMWRWLCKDKAARDASLDAVLRWPIQRLIPAHGLIVEQGAHSIVQAAFAELR